MNYVTTSEFLRGQKTQNDRLQEAENDIGQAQSDIEALKNNVGGTAGDPITCVLYKNTSEAIPNGTQTVITWDTEEIDTDGMFSSGTPSVVTCTAAGIYNVTATVFFVFNSTGNREVFVRKNSTNIAYASVPANNTAGGSHVCIAANGLSLEVGDTVSIVVWQNSGGDLLVSDAVGRTRFAIVAALGEKGADGSDGAAATIAVGAVSTLNPGESATVTNVGTSAAAVLNFGIPKGADGDGTGDVVGPASATDNAIVRFNGNTGKAVQNSLVTIDDNGSVDIPTGQTYKIGGTALAKADVGLSNVANTLQVPQVTSESDCNNMTQGFYTFTSSSANRPKNGSTQVSAGGVIMAITNGTGVLQIAFVETGDLTSSGADDYVYVRAKRDGTTWGKWRSFSTSARES